jgi:hypothetical protein
MKPINELLYNKSGYISHLFTQFPRFPLDSEGLTLLGIQGEARNIVAAFEAGRIKEKDGRVLLKGLCLKNSIRQNIQSFTR